mmetsp:Transcript_24402/g.36856  ORF Transcript_24402/g.36856 Transcript_24402/m.36856 type:complete len:435 (-) Transcript_24402:2316-3620(-)
MWLWIEATLYFINYIITLIRLGKIKSEIVLVPQQQHTPEEEEERSWSDPAPFDDASTKIIWGFWHSKGSGKNQKHENSKQNLPPLCQLALGSWKAHHGSDWKIIILNDDNFQRYVPSSDIPANFSSLSPQHRCDILRISVLIRYGGVYMDMTTIVLKSLDPFFENPTEQNNTLYLTAPLEFTNPTMGSLPNNSLLIAPQRQHPVLVAYKQKVLMYLKQLNNNKAPSFSSSHPLRHHEMFPYTQQILDDSRLGVLADIPLYLAFVYLLFETIQSMKPKAKNGNRTDTRMQVMVLPAISYSFDFLVFGQPPPSISSKHSPKIQSWSILLLLTCLYRYVYRVRFRFSQDDFQRYRKQVHCFKVSTDSPDFGNVTTKEELLDWNSTLGALFRQALKTTTTSEEEEAPAVVLEGIQSYYDFCADDSTKLESNSAEQKQL